MVFRTTPALNRIQVIFAGTLQAILSAASERLISYLAYKLTLAAHFSPVALCLVRDTMCVHVCNKETLV